MKKQTNSIIIIMVSMLVLSLASCTNVDKTIGIDMIPDDEQIVIVTDTLYPAIYNVTLDSVMPINLQYNSFGSYFDPIFGTTTAGFTFQLHPIFDTVNFGTTHTVDSVVLSMVIGSRTGEDNYQQTLKVYELNKPIYYDSVYYPCLNMNTMHDPTPVGTKQYKRNPKDRWDVSDTIRISLNKSLGDKLIAAPKEVLSMDSLKLFYQYFKGLHIITDEVTTGSTGRINQIPVSTSDLSLTVYYKRNGKDTSTVYSHYASLARSFTTVEHNYTKATHPMRVNTANLNDTTKTVSLDSTLYVQGLFGVTPMVKIRKQNIQNWLTSKHLIAGDIVISRAVLEFDVERFAGYDLERLATPLGLFYRSIQKYSANADTRSYPHITSINEIKSKSFGGTLNKTLYKYSMKLTYDFTQMLKNIDKSNSAIIYVSPYMELTSTSYYGQPMYSYVENQTWLYQTLLKGQSSSKPPRLIITYAKPRY